jgi:hypothetical protein
MKKDNKSSIDLFSLINKQGLDKRLISLSIVFFVVINYFAHRNVLITFSLYPIERSVTFNTYSINNLFWWPIALIKGNSTLYFNDMVELNEIGVYRYFGAVPYLLNQLYFITTSISVSFSLTKLFIIIKNITTRN